MSTSLGLTLYLILGLALARLRLAQGCRPGDALFGGLFWPLDFSRRWIDLLVALVLDAGVWNKRV
ncbi:MAG: hypothetical protein KBF24_00360 [Thiobacillaceae bacterium]|jgi:hypothetical protein|nr:hypothetical protein [Hydrogenophilales bacterium]MBP9914639.1 hypothetical protein [Thiobacillaceae bacterium]